VKHTSYKAPHYDFFILWLLALSYVRSWTQIFFYRISYVWPKSNPETWILSLIMWLFWIDTSINFTRYLMTLIIVDAKIHFYFTTGYSWSLTHKNLTLHQGACKSCREYGEENLTQIHNYVTFIVYIKKVKKNYINVTVYIYIYKYKSYWLLRTSTVHKL